MESERLVKLKMRKIYKLGLSFVGLLIFLTSFLGVCYLFYDKVIDPSNDIEVNGSLSINYVDGKSFDITKNNKIKFSISNSSEDVQYYNIVFLKIRGDGSYKILYNDTLINEGVLNTKDEVATDSISIDALETKIYTLEINSNENNLKGVVSVRTSKGKQENFASTILKNNPFSDNSLTKVGSDAGVENEGLIKSSDDIGVSYFFRGNITSNYVSINDVLWRIVRINGDGTVRLVLNDVTNAVSSYYNTGEFVTDYKESNIYSYLDTWFQENLRGYTSNVANTRFCNDTSVNNEGIYSSYARVITNKIPTFNCLSNSFTSKIGILSVDEVVMAGAYPDGGNNNYYLYNSEISDSWFTMSGAKGSDTTINLFMIDTSGKIKSDVAGSAYHSVRPVINLIKNTQVTGDGTIDNPYQIVTE